MITEKDRRHADLMAGFFSQLGMAFVAGGFLQLAFGATSQAAAAGIIFMICLVLHGVAHVVVEGSS